MSSHFGASNLRLPGLLGFVLVLSSSGLHAAPEIVPAGGRLTHFEINRDAFARPAPGLDAKQFREFNLGNRVFNTNWVVAPASVDGFDGLGPLFNRVSCSGCHLRDGRGRPPIEGEDGFLSMLFRISLPGSGPHGAPRPVPGYGLQLNDRAIAGVPPEAKVVLTWIEEPGAFADGESYSLRRPQVRFEDEAYGPLPRRIRVSPRVAPSVFGLGLLEAVDDESLLALADPKDRNGDGISGRVNRVIDPRSGRLVIGRFGWKAGAPDLDFQNAEAALNDIGLTSPLRPEQNCLPQQEACAAAPEGGRPELSALLLERLGAYLRTLGVPARREPDHPRVKRGEELFAAIGCDGCHLPRMRTSPRAAGLLADQEFAPYTDLLLHDMGEGLADQRREFAASGREWRTAPLWGIGLVQTVNGHEFFLHDGRARGLSEAILWHGGEARRSSERYKALSREEREALLAFLRSL